MAQGKSRIKNQKNEQDETSCQSLNYGNHGSDSLAFFACSQDDDGAVETLHATSLQISVTAQGFASGNPETRALESEYNTTFSSGDKIGITVLSGGNIVTGQDNIPCTYDGSAWVPDAAIYKLSGATYLAYYPYAEAMNGKKTAAEILTAFTPKDNQSASTDYTASDLMTGTKTATAITGTTLTFDLTHALALIEVSLPAGATDVTLKRGTTAVTPFKIGDSYRYITKAQTVTLSGGYTSSGATWTWQKTGVTLTAGKYTKTEVKNP